MSHITGRPPRIWPGSQEEARLVATYAEGLSLASTGERTGFSATVVRNALLRAGVKLRRRGYPKKHQDGLTHPQRQYRKLKADPERWRRHQAKRYAEKIFRKYGLSGEEYTQLLASQGESCGICRRIANQNSKRFAVDHDHETGKVRGILCNNCNALLGLAGDDLNVLLSAAMYLEKHKQN